MRRAPSEMCDEDGDGVETTDIAGEEEEEEGAFCCCWFCANW
jgi:hypothetical protein